MHRFREFSIKTKLILLTTACSGLALLLSSIGFIINDAAQARSTRIEQLKAQAKMLAFNSTGVLTFSEPVAAERLLASFRLQPTVQLACLYDSTGDVLAIYRNSRDTEINPPKKPEIGCRFVGTDYLELFQPVSDDGEAVGTLYLRADLSDLREKMWNYLKIVVIVTICALAASVVFSVILQHAISRPIVQLAATAQAITLAGDYTIRVQSESRDELGELYQAFNRMLDQVEASKNSLKAALANMSHEIRTPLNAILGFADLVRRQASTKDDVELCDYLETIHASGNHLLCLINDILDLSKIEAGQMEIDLERCSPHQIIAEVVSVLRVRANEKGLSLEYEWSTGIPETILTDGPRVRQLLMNLVANSIKFTEQGRVHITARLLQSTGRPQLALEVSDTGIGIPADKLETIFNPFEQADSSVTRRFGGTGLGLAISRRIAQALGGELTVRSKVDSGSTFTAVVDVGPLEGVAILQHPVADVGVRQRDTRHASGPDRLPPLKILVVEDGVTNRKLIRLVLQRAGAQVTMAENGQIGVDFATANTFDVILMDMQMPVMDGYTATRLLRGMGLTVPIIALTAHAMKGDEQTCRAAGCSGYLTKPIDADLLIRTVSEAVGGVDGKATAGGTLLPGETRAESARHAALVSTLPLDDPEFYEIVEEFVHKLREQLQEMRRTFNEGRFEELARLAHWLKGAGGTAGFDDFTAPARKLETAAKNQSAEEIGSALAMLDELAAAIELTPA